MKQEIYNIKFAKYEKTQASTHNWCPTCQIGIGKFPDLSDDLALEDQIAEHDLIFHAK